MLTGGLSGGELPSGPGAGLAAAEEGYRVRGVGLLQHPPPAGQFPPAKATWGCRDRPLPGRAGGWWPGAGGQGPGPLSGTVGARESIMVTGERSVQSIIWPR